MTTYYIGSIRLIKDSGKYMISDDVYHEEIEIEYYKLLELIDKQIIENYLRKKKLENLKK
jgi:hypothetical protein